MGLAWQAAWSIEDIVLERQRLEELEDGGEADGGEADGSV